MKELHKTFVIELTMSNIFLYFEYIIKIHMNLNMLMQDITQYRFNK